MKKILLFLLTIMLGFCSQQLSAQETLTVHDGTSTNSYVPVYGYYADAYLKAEFIMSANELSDMVGAEISAMKFYASQSSVTWGAANFQVFLTEVSSTSINAFQGSSNATIVYTGPLSISNNEMEITFTTPYTYSGDNLLIGIYNTVTGSYVSSSWYGENVNGASYQGYSYTDLNSVSGSQRNFLPKTTFTYMPLGVNCFSPNSPVISDISAYTATYSWTPRDGQSAWEVYCGTDADDLDLVTWIPVTDTFYTFTNLNAATNYNAYVRTNCGAEVSNPRQVSFTTIATCASIPSNVMVNNITATSVDVSWTAGTDDSAWEVVVVPSNATPESGTPEPTSSQPYTVTGLQDNTQYQVYVRTDCGGGDHSYWSTATTFTTQPFCSSPLDVTISQITATSALVSWQPAVFGATGYTIEYSLASEENWFTELVDGTQYMISGLEPDSTYNVMVYNNCDLGTADTMHKDFTTKHCLVGGDLQIGEGTSSTSYYPTYSCYNYSYTQQIFLANELNGPGNINSIAVDVYSIQSSSRQISIYLMHTTAASSDWLAATNAQLVYNGTVNLTLGWNTFNFTTPFQYNGTNNLALIIIDGTGSYSCSNYYNCHTTSATLSNCQYQDDGPYSINTLPSNTGGYNYASSTRCNIIFGFDCDNDVTCVRPNIYVTETSESSITLDWAVSYTENEWDIEYSTDNTNWETAGTVNTHPYEVTGLNADTRYYLRVRSNCGGEESDWSVATARTDCGPILELPYFNNFEDVISDNGTNFITCWSRYTTDPSRVVRCYNSAVYNGSYSLDFNYSPTCTTAVATPMLDASIPLNTVMVDFWAYSGLGQGWMEVGTMSDPNDFSTYEFYDTVRLSSPNTWENVIISFENYSGSNQYIAFLEINGTTTSYIFDDFTINYLSNCMHPTTLTLDDYTNTSVTLSWIETGNASSWTIEYGPVGFTPGSGTSVSASSIPFTVENLTPATTYDFYVYADCGGELSEPFGPLAATPGQYVFNTNGSDTLTTCSVLLYDNGGATGDYSSSSDFTLVLYPENPDAVMALIGTSSTESCCDYLRVYDGVGTSGQQLAEYKGENLTVNVLSQSGPLTLVFHSDGSVVKSGFAITASCVTCYPPTNITTSNPTLDGASVAWSGTGDSYVLFLNGDMTTGYEANDTTYTFTGLNSSTMYSVQVASICNGDTSMLSAAASFVTACDAITITEEEPWIEDFENYIGSGVQQFICWERPITEVTSNGTAPFVYCNYGQAAHSGVNTAEMKGSINMLALPEFTNDISELRLSFWATGYSYTNTNVEVGYITDVTDSSTFVSIANAGTPGPRGGSNGGNGNYMGPFDFNGVTATDARIALRYTGPGSSSGWNVDDFVVELTPGCPSPVKTSLTATQIGGHVANINWVDNDDTHTAWIVYYKESTDSVWSTASATDTTTTLTDLDPLTTYDVYVITDCGTPSDNPDATHTIQFTTTVACPAPTNLTLASVSTNEATITWDGTANSYNVEYGESGFTPGTGITDVASTESYVLTNLNPSTTYTIYLNSDCTDANDSLSSTVSFSFTTTQVPADLPYTADFTASNEWIFNNGTCANYWATGMVNSTPALYVSNNGTTPGYDNTSNSVVSAEKLLAVGDNASVLISFDAYIGGESSYDYLKVFFAPAETSYPAATSVPTYGTNTYSTNSINFSDYLSQTTGNTSYPYKLNLTNDTLHITVEMPNPNENASSASTAKLVFLWRNDGSAGTQPGAIISNVNVIVNACPMPSNLALASVTSNSADITWTAGDVETEWELEYGTHGFAHGNGTIELVSTTPSVTLNNLIPGTTYDIYVRALCDASDTSAWVGPIMVSPGTYNLPTSGNHSITSCGIIIYDDGGVTGDYSSSSDAYLTINPETTGNLISIHGTLNTESCCDYLEIFDGTNASGTLLGDYRGNNVTIPELISTTGPITLHFHSDGSVTYSGFELTVVCASGTCPAPTDFTVSNVGVNIADLSWTPGGSETSWVVEYKAADDDSWTQTTVTTPSYQLTGLTALTAYDVRVKADCGGGDESTYKNASFTTNACDPSEQCTYTFLLSDGYGDGWNGGYLTVEQNDIVIATVELTNGSSATQTVILCDNISTNLVWHMGQYDDEISITLNGPDGTQVYTVEDLETNYSNPLFTFTTNCSGSGPVVTDPSVTTGNASAPTQTSASLNATITNPDNVTITAKGFEWKATNGGSYTQIAGTGTGNDFSANLTGLTANTSYTFKAFISFNGETVYGNEVIFTTLNEDEEPCNAPSNLTVSDITAHTATMSWNVGGSETSWKVGYKLQSASQWQEATVQTTSYSLEGLTAESTYDVRVKAICTDNESDFVSSNFTTAEEVGIDNITLANSISLMPNPADNYIELRVNSNVDVTEAVVYNAFGQMIQTVQLTDNHARIDLSNMAAGMYFVRVNGDNVTATKKFIRK